MYKIMIVDDEILVRIGLKSTINWEEIGFTIAAEASNGEQAYELFQRYAPEVILTDIRMPKMDGLKLTELVKSRNPKVKVVILTCYDEFAYAREALKLGASHYILKSEIEDDELIHLMEKIRGELDVEMGRIEKFSMLQHQINSNINVLKEKMLNDLIDSKVRINKDFYLKCESLNFSVEDTSFLLMGLYKDNMDDFANYSQSDWQLMDYGIINIASEILGEKSLQFLVSTRNSGFIFLIGKSGISVRDMEPVIKRIKDSVLKYLNISVSAVLSGIFNDIAQTGGIFKECDHKSQIMFYSGRGVMIHTNNAELGEVNTVEFKERYTKQLLEQMDEEDLQAAREVVYNLEKVFTEKQAVPMQVKLYYISLINDVLEHYYGCFSDEHEFNDYSNYSNLILKADKMSDITRLGSIFAEGVISSIKNNRMTNSRNIIHKAISYIDKNYYEKVSLESLAAYTNLSKQYLCYIFKRETGENVSVYINKVRVEKAKELIKKHDYRVKELFDKVGFSDQQYFCKTFKKVTGMTIAEYKEEITKRANR